MTHAFYKTFNWQFDKTTFSKYLPIYTSDLDTKVKEVKFSEKYKHLIKYQDSQVVVVNIFM